MHHSRRRQGGARLPDARGAGRTARRIETVEGLAAKDGTLSTLQFAFHRNFALQCGYCTPGFLMTLTDYLERHENPTEADIRIALSGNICRCTGYAEIVDAALEAAKEMRAQRAKVGDADACAGRSRIRSAVIRTKSRNGQIRRSAITTC